MFVVYHKETTYYLTYSSRYANVWNRANNLKTEAAAKALITREVKKGNIVKEDYAIAEVVDFKKNIEKTRTTGNILNPKAGTWEIPVNTPASCDPGTETYHSM